MSFVHLHVHTQYSMLQGAIRIDNLIQKTLDYGMPAVAITDTHNCFGSMDFYFEAVTRGVKPIMGCELYFSAKGRSPQNKNFILNHIVVLCKNIQGYRNLSHLITSSYQQNSAFQQSILGEKASGLAVKPMIDLELLDQWGDDLLVLSGGLKGPLSSRILFHQEPEALELLTWFKKRFQEDFYLELQDIALPEQEIVNTTLAEWGSKYQIATIATSDCHYLEEKDAIAHEVLQCIESGRTLSHNRTQLIPTSYYFKSPEAMRTNMGRYPNACENTLAILDKIDLKFSFKDKEGRPIYHLPTYKDNTNASDPPQDTNSVFAALAEKGLKQRFTSQRFKNKDYHLYKARLDQEVTMISKTGFAAYFLIVADFINWAKIHKIPVGPGRGSGAGSLVSYALRITEIDPIEFNLLFERFINPERISMPDFDVDFCQDRRGEVIKYVTEKYGSHNVCQIITFGKLQARVVLKDVGRVLGISYAETDELTKLFPDGLDMTLEKVMHLEPRFATKIRQNERLSQVFEIAQALEGLVRNAGVHAAGVIITEKPVVEYCPLYAGKDHHWVTQLDKDFCEKIGLIKFDFLGLKTLTVIDNTVELIQRYNADHESFDIDGIALDAGPVFDLISSGDTDGVFQIESSGMKDLCTRIVPSNLEDLTAINALYRPGPLGSGMVDDFIDRKHQRKKITYDAPQLASILKDTYGVILYQEQVMQIARELGGYSLGQADLLRRAMGKKKPDEMAKHRQIFKDGAVKKGLSVHTAESIFELMAKFAEYGFNKSHSAAYGLLSYQTAYLKAYYPVEFMAALMTTEMMNTDKLSKYIADAQSHKIKVLPPDINSSTAKFSVTIIEEQKKAIRFGLEAIKGVGQVAVEAILEARHNGDFKNLLDLCLRVSLRKLNKKVLESLCLAGALDSIITTNRATIFESIQSMLDMAVKKQKEQQSGGQLSLFQNFTASIIPAERYIQDTSTTLPDWSLQKKLALEKQVVGFYISGHPMGGWQTLCEQIYGSNTQKLKAMPKTTSQGDNPYDIPARPEIQCAGIVTNIKEIITKKGHKMAFIEIEDLYGKIEGIFFPDAYKEHYDTLQTSFTHTHICYFHADYEHKDDQPKLIIKGMKPLDRLPQIKKLNIKINIDATDPSILRELKEIFLKFPGKTPVQFTFYNQHQTATLSPNTHFFLAPEPALVLKIKEILSDDALQIAL